MVTKQNTTRKIDMKTNFKQIALFEQGLHGCSVCGEIKGIKYFNRNKNKSAGLASECKDCKAKKAKIYRKESTLKNKKMSKENRLQPITETILKKFSAYLQIFKENCESRQFGIMELCREFRVPNTTPTAMVNLGYAKRIKVGIYEATYTAVEPRMARLVVEEVIRIQTGYLGNSQMKKDPEEVKTTERHKYTSNQLSEPYVYTTLGALESLIDEYLDTPIPENWYSLDKYSKWEWLKDKGDIQKTGVDTVFGGGIPLLRTRITLFEVWVECLRQTPASFQVPSNAGKILSNIKSKAKLLLNCRNGWVKAAESTALRNNGLGPKYPTYVRIASENPIPVVATSYENGLSRLTQEELNLIQNGKNADTYQKEYEQQFKENLLLKNKIEDYKKDVERLSKKCLEHEKHRADLFKNYCFEKRWHHEANDRVVELERELDGICKTPVKKQETLFLKKLVESGTVAIEIDYAQGKCEALRIEDLQILTR
jgi:hypothetical protein